MERTRHADALDRHRWQPPEVGPNDVQLSELSALASSLARPLPARDARHGNHASRVPADVSVGRFHPSMAQPSVALVALW